MSNTHKHGGRVAVYARLSVTTEESVSIERQLEAGRKYAEARGWEVVGEYIDDGVSATKNRPEQRAGWRAVLDAPERYDAVVVWKVDRLARRVLDFLNADAALRERGAGLVAVEDPIDMTTAQGRAFATMLAVFGELEASAISARVTAARRAILQVGRRAGGRPPYGYMNVPNPEGAGMILAQDPERIGVVEELVRRALDGSSLYSLARWLEAEGVEPRARANRKHAGRWDEATVETILRAPALAGMTPYAPGRKPGEEAKPHDVLRDADGLPIVDESVAVITPEERRRLLATLDDAKRPGTRQRAGAEPALLYGLARCGTCGGHMHRATANGYRVYRCQQHGCERRSNANRPALEAFVTEEFLAAVGRLAVVRVEEDPGADATPDLTEIEHAIADTLAAMGEDDADVGALADRLAGLKSLRARAREEATAQPAIRAVATGETFRQAWEAAEDDEARRQLLASALEAVEVAPGGRQGVRVPVGERARLVWRAEDTLAAVEA